MVGFSWDISCSKLSGDLLKNLETSRKMGELAGLNFSVHLQMLCDYSLLLRYVLSLHAEG